MPSSKRDLIKRKHDAMINALTRAQRYSLELHDMFQEYHPTYSEGYGNIIILIQHNIDLIKQMRGFV